MTATNHNSYNDEKMIIDSNIPSCESFVSNSISMWPALSLNRMVLAGCLILLFLSAGSFADDSTPLTGAALLARIYQQPEQIRPVLFSATSSATRSDIAFVIDGTTSMPMEIDDLARHLEAVVSLLSPAELESTRVAVVVYRDTRSPSGVVTVVSPLTNDLNKIRDELRTLKVESGEPYFTEAMDQGVYAALDQLEWRTDGSDTFHRLMIVGDAAPYATDSEHRKYRTSDLSDLANKKRVRIDALLVNSGFAPSSELPDAPSRDTAIKAAPIARKFLTELTAGTRGVFIDFWQEGQIATLQEKTVQIHDLSVPESSADKTSPFSTESAWQIFLAKHLRSVRAERPALLAVKALSELKARQSPLSSPFPQTYADADVQVVIDHLESALEEEPQNPVLHLLLANAHLLSAYHDAYEDHSQRAMQHVAFAYSNKDENLPAAILNEIDGLHALLIEEDRAAAMKAFEKLNSDEYESQNPGCQLRGCWNLLSLQLTFWPVSDVALNETASNRTTIDESACKKLIATICEKWPGSVESAALRARLNASSDKLCELPQSLFMFPRAN